MNVLDLFSGIGGFSIGLERAGMRSVAFCEIEPYPRAVLAKHWPGIPIYPDVRSLTARQLRADGVIPDVICGGFPCQDISNAGKRGGIDGARSGLWSDFSRIIGEAGPSYVIVENVAALIGRGLGRVLGDLAALGFDAEWHCIPASYAGAPHRRDRIWIVAHANSARSAHAGKGDPRGKRFAGRHPVVSGRDEMADAGGAGLSLSQCETLLRPGWWEEGRAASERGWWSAEPALGRVAYGVPNRVDRLKCLGNSIVPQIAEIIGRAIMARHQPSGSGEI